jgi:hypothetical protein
MAAAVFGVAAGAVGAGRGRGAAARAVATGRGAAASAGAGSAAAAALVGGVAGGAVVAGTAGDAGAAAPGALATVPEALAGPGTPVRRGQASTAMPDASSVPAPSSQRRLGDGLASAAGGSSVGRPVVADGSAAVPVQRRKALAISPALA